MGHDGIVAKLAAVVVLVATVAALWMGSWIITASG
jgi:hypothetical protein